jgi:hypothetical protein
MECAAAQGLRELSNYLKFEKQGSIAIFMAIPRVFIEEVKYTPTCI